jgi:hypothetical protein
MFDETDWKLLEDRGKRASELKRHIIRLIEEFYAQHGKPMTISRLSTLVRSRDRSIHMSDFIRFIIAQGQLVGVYSPHTGVYYVFPKEHGAASLESLAAECFLIDQDKAEISNRNRSEKMKARAEEKKRDRWNK